MSASPAALVTPCCAACVNTARSSRDAALEDVYREAFCIGTTVNAVPGVPGRMR